MNILSTAPLSLDNFYGPLDYLVHLVQRGEIDIGDIPLQRLTEQFIEQHLYSHSSSIEIGAEFVALTSTLLLLKSKYLLPAEEMTQAERQELDTHFKVIHELVDYCRFKKAAQELSQLEVEQLGCSYRPAYNSCCPRALGLEQISLEELSSLFQQALSRAASYTGTVYEEKFRVCDAISALKQQLKERNTLTFKEVFHADLYREEMIVFFLALLELMKVGFLIVVGISSEEIQIQLAIKED